MFYKICPKCLSTKISVEKGTHFVKVDGILKLPDDFSELHKCKECHYQGMEIIEGNEHLLEFLKKRHPESAELQKPVETEEQTAKKCLFGEEPNRERNFAGISIKLPNDYRFNKIIEG